MYIENKRTKALTPDGEQGDFDWTTGTLVAIAPKHRLAPSLSSAPDFVPVFSRTPFRKTFTLSDDAFLCVAAMVTMSLEASTAVVAATVVVDPPTKGINSIWLEVLNLN